MKLCLCLLLLSSFALAENKFGYLSPEDQKFYKNDIMEGNNQRERIDSLVKEANKIYGEISLMKAEIQTLKKEVEELKKAK